MFQKMSKVALSLLLLIVISTVTGCLDNEEPTDANIIGHYTYENDEFIIDIYLFPDNKFLDLTYYFAEDETYAGHGDYELNQTTRDIYFNFDYLPKEYNYSGLFSRDMQTLTSDMYDCKKTNLDIKPKNYSKSQIARSYILEYIYENETVRIELELNEDGTFYEVASYPETGEEFPESGEYTFFPESGYVFLSYYEWPDGNYGGVIDLDENLFYTVEGIFKVQ